MAEAPSLLGEARSLRAFLGDFTAEATQAAVAVKIDDYDDGVSVLPRRIRAAARDGANPPFTVSLARSSEGWTGRCSCPAGHRCRHLYALGARRLAQLAGVTATRATPPSPVPPSPAPTLSAAAVIDGLMDYLRFFDPGTRTRGLAISRGPAVRILGVNRRVLSAQVSGSANQPYVTALRHGVGGWSGECSCPVGHRCKHLYALGIKAIETAPDRLREIVAASPRASASAPGAKTPAPPVVKPLTFRQIWEPRLAEKLGRALLRDEGELLGKLAAAFNEFRSRGALFKSWLHENGLASTPDHPPGRFSYEHAFEGYWTRDAAPADPWALWQYIAYDWQRAGRPIPEVFVPMTDTAPVRATLDQILLQRELEVWRQALHPVSDSRFEAVRSEVGELANTADLRLQITADAHVEIQGHFSTLKSARVPWRTVSARWLRALDHSGPEEWAHFPEPARQLALALRLRPLAPHGVPSPLTPRLAVELLDHVLAQDALHGCLVLPDGGPFRLEPAPLQLVAQTLPDDPTRLSLYLALPDGTPLPVPPPRLRAGDASLYLWDNRVWPGPPPPVAARLPIAALSEPALGQRLREIGLRLPGSLAARFQTVSLPPFLRLWTQEDSYQSSTTLRATLQARSATPPCAQVWTGFKGWQWLPPGAPRAGGPDAPHFHFDLATAKAVGARFGDFRFSWWEGEACWARPVGQNFPEEFIAWRATLPADLEIEVSPDLRGLLAAPLHARISVDLSPVEGSGQDWFDLSLQLTPEDTTLTPEELQLLVKARGAWVRLPARGWQRLALTDAMAPENRAALERLGVSGDEALSGRRTTHRFHALQLAAAPLDDALAASLRARAETLRALPPPALPAGLRASLRPYQQEGYHFLAHLSALGLGGVLADDMGLGKTLQSLAWLLRLAETKAASAPDARPFRALVVAPKSVVPNWAVEAARFAPSLTTARLAPGLPPAPDACLVVVNYTQLRLRAEALAAEEWDAVVLDEGQNIKNPASATARAACALRARHRLALSGTPIENRLLDLWSLLAFTQPGLLGTQASFQRLYNEKTDPAGARARLAARVRPFLLRRTKSQVAKDLPPRIEEEIECELEGPQRALYEAELKRARQLLLAVKDARQFDAQRFNLLQSLLRLRQICCDPRLLGFDAEGAVEAVTSSPAARSRPADVPPPAAGAKLEALFDTLEPLVAEGHRVLVFSQFTRMLDLIADELRTREIAHLLLTGKTGNRQELVERFQGADGPAVFLLSLKAAGTGLNLTAAGYVVLFDPWWNPAVEAQAIDRAHRIGQSNTVIAYRLVAKDTIEQKIRALQREKAALAAAVVQEESFATVMDLDSLRHILGEGA